LDSCSIFAATGQQLLHHRFLAHGVDEAGVRDVHGAQLALRVLVQQHLHRADQALEVRRVAQLGDMRHHLRADAVQEAQTLVADGHRLHRRTRALQIAQLLRDRAQHVGVEAAAQALVGGDHDDARSLHVVRLHERVRVLRVGLAEVGGDVANLLA
jgi:hypothetical protein